MTLRSGDELSRQLIREIRPEISPVSRQQTIRVNGCMRSDCEIGDQMLARGEAVSAFVAPKVLKGAAGRARHRARSPLQVSAPQFASEVQRLNVRPVPADSSVFEESDHLVMRRKVRRELPIDDFRNHHRAKRGRHVRCVTGGVGVVAVRRLKIEQDIRIDRSDQCPRISRTSSSTSWPSRCFRYPHHLLKGDSSIRFLRWYSPSASTNSSWSPG